MADAQAWMQADVAVAELGERISVYVLRYDSESDEIKAVYVYNPEQAHPVSGLVSPIIGFFADTLLEWDQRDPIPFDPQLVCVQDTETSTLAEGESADVDTLVMRSIADLDPTAASLLFARAGRERMEELWSNMFADPRNKPLLAPCEVERVKLAPLASIRENFEQADEAQRRVLLGSEIAQTPAVMQMYELWSLPVSVETAGHFVTPMELALAMLIFDDLSIALPDAPIARTMELLDGVSGFDHGWSIAAGEPGVIAWVAVVHTGEQERHVIAILAHDADQPLDTQQVSAAIGAVVTALQQITSD